ncbi:twin-arginine translocase subunit TatB [Spiribacter sp. 2438]|uniref:Sec-independent protein translocase protein TatB n=1 Tax=Spiribacter sp. 2438 TaxID=2666185 RepID=UPI0012B0C3F9|nr:Sec-independent protein translocase protein TatB [Spiribacter sp. 2438]QGM20892.1 twin-arginine translocase subunit TatB [Spiribacter sp. 2438]
MFDVSFIELLIIAVIALVVVGPERLPRVMRTVGLWVGRARASFQTIREEVEREVNAEGLRETREALNRKARETEREINEAVDVSAKSPSEDAADGTTPTRAAGAPEESPVKPASRGASDQSPPGEDSR